MNKQTFIIILQAALFSFDGATKKEIIDYNVYPEKLVDIGIKLCLYLKEIKTEQEQPQ